MVDPKVDMPGTLRQLDQWEAKVRARIPPDASNKVKVDLLISTLYKPGPWNDYRSFGYDFTDPFGKDLHNSLLSTYLERRKGQCMVMPIAIVLLGQKLGLPMTLTTAPYHLIAKYGDEEQGAWTNLDATSGLFHPDSGYEQALKISPEAIRSETFQRVRGGVCHCDVGALLPAKEPAYSGDPGHRFGS
ncbi:transglutaminase-like domain-containing protein [Xanthomonas hyacinthi]|uniref:transglutaminase-like domain-containing protein n=1 Tax=Xanthomonas hyacinthi TaxID=56455 RepID=UPI001FCC5B58|nr:transglutaminase-like domain-containing protein [Xanthomonas hyacinthi]